MFFNAEEENKKNPSEYDPIPAGWYYASIEGVELKTTKAGDGQFIAVTFSLIGKQEGRKLWHNYNISNPNEMAEKIGRGELARLCIAVGKVQLSAPEDLLNSFVDIKVTIKPDNRDKDVMRNFITQYAEGDKNSAKELAKPVTDSALPF